MMAAPVSALELGELKINSSLGQPLRASIAYALNPREELYDFCVYLRPSFTANGLPIVSRATVSIADGLILLAGSRAIREPLLTMQVSIDCPYTAHISREYTLMINPPTPVIREGPIVVEPAAMTESRAATAATQARKSRPPVKSSRNLDLSPISEGSRYLVQHGDSLSEIASRISDRSIALWPAVDRIFAANPDAFMDGDMNRLKAGSWLDVPDLSLAAQEPDVSVAAQEPMNYETDSTVANTSESDAENLTIYTGYQATAPVDEVETITEPYDTQGTAVSDVTETEEPLVVESDAGDFDFAKLQPGDVVVGNDTAFVSPIGIEADDTIFVDIPDIEIIEPAVQPVPVVNTTQNNDKAGKTTGSWSWLIWLGGTGLALILGLLLFGQRFRQKFGSVAVAAAPEPLPNRGRTDASSPSTEAEEDFDFEIPDVPPQSAFMTLDADFDDGSGLQDGSDIDVAQDFGFSASTTFDGELDMVIPVVVEDEESSEPTALMPAVGREVEQPTFETEVLPSEDDDYDMSMILDVTKQDMVGSDATEKDLRAIQVDSESEPESDDLTLSGDVDYKILEQDYEDELTATQVLNAEIVKAAAELADHMDTEVTGEMIAKLPDNTQAVNDDINDSGASVDVTVEIPGAGDEPTVEMPATDDEVSFDTEIESDKVDNKKRKKAS